jgi:hypothetical protein
MPAEGPPVNRIDGPLGTAIPRGRCVSEADALRGKVSLGSPSRLAVNHTASVVWSHVV